MFKAIKNNKVIAMNDTGVFPCLMYDNIEQDTEHTTADYIQVNGEYVLTTSNEAIEQKQAEVRSIRNQYLTDSDKYMFPDFPITDEQQADYVAYRRYLRTYPEKENWYELEPVKFDVWQAEQITEPESSSQNNSSEDEYNTQVEQESPDDSSELEADMDAILGTKMQ